MRLRDAWDEAAGDWIAWARRPDHDSYWRFHREAWLPAIPPPGELTLDIGCGEGRLSRDLVALGHRVIGIDGSQAMARAAVEHPGAAAPVVVADAARLPVSVGAVDLALAFMSLQDVDDFEAAIAEVGRVLRPGGVFMMAVVHPINSLGEFEGRTDDARFVITENYFERRYFTDRCERAGLTMTFHSEHRPLSDYSDALYRAGLRIERISEVTDTEPGDRWQRIPMFLHIRAVKP